MGKIRRGNRIWRKIPPDRPEGTVQKLKVLLRRAFRLKSNDIFGMEKGNRSILYTSEGRALLRRHKGIVKDFLFARSMLVRIKERKGAKMDVHIGPMRVERVFSDGDMHDYLYRVRMEEKVFFIKEQGIPQGEANIRFRPEHDFADAQMKTLSHARKALREMKGVEVAHYHLAWRNGNRSFLVTDFYEGEKLADEKGDFTKPFWEGQWINIRLRAYDVMNRLDPYFSDIHPGNMLYDSVHDRLIVFDLRLK